MNIGRKRARTNRLGRTKEVWQKIKVSEERNSSLDLCSKRVYQLVVAQLGLDGRGNYLKQIEIAVFPELPILSHRLKTEG